MIIAIVVVLHKGGYPDDINSYNAGVPYSTVQYNYSSKVLEHVIKKGFNRFVDERHRFVKEQFGFQGKRSIGIALLTLKENKVDNFGCKKFAVGLFLD